MLYRWGGRPNFSQFFPVPVLGFLERELGKIGKNWEKLGKIGKNWEYEKKCDTRKFIAVRANSNNGSI